MTFVAIFLLQVSSKSVGGACVLEDGVEAMKPTRVLYLLSELLRVVSTCLIHEFLPESFLPTLKALLKWLVSPTVLEKKARRKDLIYKSVPHLVKASPMLRLFR